MAKKLVSGTILTPLVPNQAFLKNLASSVTRYHGLLSSCTISGKTDDPILRKVSDGQTDESDLIGHCPTKVGRPKNDYLHIEGYIMAKTSFLAEVSFRQLLPL